MCIVTILIPQILARQSPIQRNTSDFIEPVGTVLYVLDNTILAEAAGHLPDVPSAQCFKCRHHTSICLNLHTRPVTGTSLSNQVPKSLPTVAAGAVQVPVTSSMYVNSPTSIQQRTAKAIVHNASQPESTSSLEVRAILDLRSQRSYVTVCVQEALNMRKVRSESMIIKTFGLEGENKGTCDIVELGIVTKNGEPLTLSAVVVPHICHPVRMQPISSFKNAYEHPSELELADLGGITGELEIDVLIGSDHYWRLVTGRVSRGVSGPTTVKTRLWMGAVCPCGGSTT